MEIGALPWEASAAALELLRNSDVVGRQRPPVRLAKWFWRVTLAVPNASFEIQARVALVMASHESLGLPWPEGEEWRLAYQPWDAPHWESSYQQALTRKDNPIPSPKSLEAMAPETDDVVWMKEYWENRRREIAEAKEKHKQLTEEIKQLEEAERKAKGGKPRSLFSRSIEEDNGEAKA